MTLNDIENLKGRFFKCENDLSVEYWYIENTKVYHGDDKYDIELQVIFVDSYTFDRRRRLQSCRFNCLMEIDSKSIPAECLLSHYGNFEKVNEISKEEFKKELFTYFDEIYNIIFNETPN